MFNELMGWADRVPGLAVSLIHCCPWKRPILSSHSWVCWARKGTVRLGEPFSPSALYYVLRAMEFAECKGGFKHLSLLL